jgi:hypothetical protein
MPPDEGLPRGQRPGEAAAVGAGEEPGQGSPRGQREIEQMDLPVGRERGGRPGKERFDLLVPQVVQEAVDEHAVEGSLVGQIEGGGIPADEPAAMAAAGRLHIVRREIDADVARRVEEMRVGAGAAAEFEHAARPRRGPGREKRRDLLRDERRLPEGVDGGAIKDPADVHGAKPAKSRSAPQSPRSVFRRDEPRRHARRRSIDERSRKKNALPPIEFLEHALGERVFRLERDGPGKRRPGLVRPA